MAASASSSQVLCGKYDVFISFRGSDVRFGFLSHLKKEYRRKNIDVYVDDRLESGEEISSALVNAIENSRIALVIFSKHYASSRWCLQELVKIMECKEDHQQIVIPVFYLVDPSDVRHQKHTYAEAFTLHEEKYKENVDNLRIWRSVLKKSADLSGYNSSKFLYESNLVDAIVEGVWKKLEENSSIVPKSELIGFNYNFTIVEQLMEINIQDVRVLGIWGMGGIGKTTLARAISDKFLSEFESHCFLKNVREKSKEIDGLSSLREKLLSKLLDQKDHQNKNADAMRWLKRKKVLIVLDDVDESKQLRVLAGKRCLQLGPGSRVIVTSRDRQVLRSGGILDKYIHEVNALNLEESLQLFCTHAFDQSQPENGYEVLSTMTVATAKGIPLALELLGSHFYSRDKAYWESELSKLKKHPHERIQNILKISYDGLHVMDKEIFLDIAFFFMGLRKDEIICGLEACGFKAVSGIENLIDKALIKFDSFGNVVMHDSIQEMAEQIVRKKCSPVRRSRLKDIDEICDILERNMGTGEIEGIMLKQSDSKYPPPKADFFLKIENLRILKVLANVELPYDLDSFPNKLRYLIWNDYPLESLPSGSYLKNLVELHLENSNVKKLWDGKQDVAMIKKINLLDSGELMELPDLSMAHRLEILVLKGCRNLRSVHASILSLHTIVSLDASGCRNLESLDGETHLESLSNLDVSGCDGLKRFCLSSKKLRCLDLSFSKVKIFRFPTGRCEELRELFIVGGILGGLLIDTMELRGLTNLEVLEVFNFEQVIDTMELHSLFDAWRNLIHLRLDGWIYLSEIPNSINGLTKLECLSLCDSGVETLPACLNHHSSLRRISLRRCKRLKSILGLPPSLQTLDATDCTLLKIVSSDSQLHNQCRFLFNNCAMLDESSLCFIEKLACSSVACYPRSRVPLWMKYRQMTCAPNVVEFTWNFEPSLAIVFCCVTPHDLISGKLVSVSCHISCYDNHKISSESDVKCNYELNSDHVFVWHAEARDLLNGIGTVNVVRIICEFSVHYDDEEKNKVVIPAKACGVHLIYYSESGQKRRRVADMCVKEQLTPKKLKNSGVSHDDNFICHPLQLKFLGRGQQNDLSLIHFL